MGRPLKASDRVTVTDLGQVDEVKSPCPARRQAGKQVGRRTRGCGAGWWSWLTEEYFVSGMTNE